MPPSPSVSEDLPVGERFLVDQFAAEGCAVLIGHQDASGSLTPVQCTRRFAMSSRAGRWPEESDTQYCSSPNLVDTNVLSCWPNISRLLTANLHRHNSSIFSLPSLPTYSTVGNNAREISHVNSRKWNSLLLHTMLYISVSMCGSALPNCSP